MIPSSKFMKIFLTLALVLAGLFRAPLVQAQQRFQPGYLILQLGDTVRGYVEAPTRNTVMLGVAFKKTPQEAAKVVYPLKSVRSLQLTGGKTYVMRRMQPTMRHDTLRILLEPLVQGRANLYRSSRNVFTNSPEEEMFANSFTSVYYYIERSTETKRPPYLLNSNSYRQDLRSLFSDCGAAPAVTGKFSETNLIQLVRQYNACPTGSIR